MRFILSLAVAAVTAILFLGCGSTEEVSENDLQALASSPAVITPTATAAPTLTASATPAATDAPAPTASLTPSLDAWTTYVDPVNGFSLIHPPDLQFSDHSDPNSQVGLRSLEFRSPEDRNRAFTAVVAANDRGLTVEEWAREFTPCHFDEPFVVESIAAAGKLGITCTGEAVTGKFTLVAVFPVGANMFILNAALPDDEFQAILADLQFPQV